MKAVHDAQAPKPKKLDRNWKKRSFFSKEEINQIVKMAQDAQTKMQGKAKEDSNVEELNNFEMLKIRTKEDSDDEYTLLWKEGQFQNSRGRKHSRCDSLNVLDECNNLYLNNSPKKRVKKLHLTELRQNYRLFAFFEGL